VKRYRDGFRDMRGAGWVSLREGKDERGSRSVDENKLKKREICYSAEHDTQSIQIKVHLLKAEAKKRNGEEKGR